MTARSTTKAAAKPRAALPTKAEADALGLVPITCVCGRTVLTKNWAAHLARTDGRKHGRSWIRSAAAPMADRVTLMGSRTRAASAAKPMIDRASVIPQAAGPRAQQERELSDWSEAQPPLSQPPTVLSIAPEPVAATTPAPVRTESAQAGWERLAASVRSSPPEAVTHRGGIWGWFAKIGR